MTTKSSRRRAASVTTPAVVSEEDAPTVDPDERDAPVVPVHTIRVVPEEDEPLRCGGHVLVPGRGWVPEASLESR